MRHAKSLGDFLSRLGTRPKRPAAAPATPPTPKDLSAYETPRDAEQIKPDMYVSMYQVNEIWRGIDISEFGPPGLMETGPEKAMREKVMLMVDRAFQADEIGIKASNDRTTIGYPSSGITMMFSGDPAPSEYDAGYLDNYYLRAGDLMRIAKDSGLDHPRFERSLHRLGTALINVSNAPHTAREQANLRQVHKGTAPTASDAPRQPAKLEDARPSVSPDSPIQL